MNRWTKFCATFEENLGDKLSKFAGIQYDHPYISLTLLILIIVASIGGFYFQETENSVSKIYVPQDAPILVNERYYNKKWNFLPAYEAVWLTSESVGKNVLTKAGIDMMFNFDKKVKEIEITYDDKLYTFYDLCTVNAITNECQVSGILDFWNYNQSLVEQDKIIGVINDQKNIVTGQYLDESAGMLGLTKNNNGEIIEVAVLTLDYAMEKQDEKEKPTEKWEKKLIDELIDLKNQLEEDNSKFQLMFEAYSSIDDEVEKAGASDTVTYVIGYLLMGIVLWLTIATSIVVTTLTDIVVLLIGLSSPFDAVVYFCGYGCFCVFFVFFFQFTLFTLMLSFEAKRIHNKRNAFLPCMGIKTNKLPTKGGEDEMVDEKGEEKKQKIQKKKKKKDVENSDSDLNSGSDSNSKSNSSTASDLNTDIKKTKKKNVNEKKLKLDVFQRFLKEKYGPFILNKKVSIIILIIFVGYFGASIYFATQVEEGFEETSVLPDDSYLQDSYEILDKYYYPNGEVYYIVIKEDTKYHEAETKNELLKLIDDFRNNEKWVSRGPYSWYEDYLNYLQTEDDAPTLDSDGLPENPEEFYSYLKDSFLEKPDYIHYNLGSDIVFNEDEDDINKQIEVSRFYYVSTDLSSQPDMINYMYDLRDLTTDSKIDCFVYNIWYFLVEQYAVVKESTFMSVGFAILAILFLSFIFFVYPTNALLISLTIIMIDVDLYGFLWIMKLDIEPVSCVCLIMSVGFAVDYAAHIIHSYTTSKEKTRREKVLDSLAKIGSSVLLGSITTFLGLTPIIIFATSEIFRTLVKILYATIISGILHGFVFLPVVLQFLGAKGNTTMVQQNTKSEKNNDDSSSKSDGKEISHHDDIDGKQSSHDDDSDGKDSSSIDDSDEDMNKSKNSGSNSGSGSSSKTDNIKSSFTLTRNNRVILSPNSSSSD
ncbi:patched domain-containing protein [Anaeramoeba flamelloides]|uniref:Patched domain-containing protein n=1 Tax=Anaeramoeba flamelloides TaxID=1746091 RepID=A0ABQ8YBG1_9EUKA|nr:patched domain-containing protein [Anaeramoeba flamelloides]